MKNNRGESRVKEDSPTVQRSSLNIVSSCGLFRLGRSAQLNALRSYSAGDKQFISHNYVRNESIIVS